MSGEKNISRPNFFVTLFESLNKNIIMSVFICVVYICILKNEKIKKPLKYFQCNFLIFTRLSAVYFAELEPIVCQKFFLTEKKLVMQSPFMSTLEQALFH